MGLRIKSKLFRVLGACGIMWLAFELYFKYGNYPRNDRSNATNVHSQEIIVTQEPLEVTTVPDKPGLYALPRLGETECCNFQMFKERCDQVMSGSCAVPQHYNLFSHGWGVDLMVNTGNKIGPYVFSKGIPFYLTTYGNDGWHYAKDVCPLEKQNLECYFQKVAATTPQLERSKATCNTTLTTTAVEHCCDEGMFHQLGYQYLTQPLPKYRDMAAKRAEELRMPEGEACATLHVRRSDSLLNFGWGGTGKAVFRNVSVAEYLEIAQPYLEKRNVKHILLMTDDQDAVYETAANPQYTWHVLNRTRFSGVEGGWENHFPSGTRQSEVVDVLALLLATAQCSTMIGSGSRFSYMHYTNSKFYHKEPWMVFVNTNNDDRKAHPSHINYNQVNSLKEKYRDTPQVQNPNLKKDLALRRLKT
eukprot:m.219790 g.219790  ORF g.219790 m.219790 type:complete len:417 (+) comp33305_c0_seq1:278-1528(+)